HQRGAVLEQHRIEAFGKIVQPLRRIRERDAAETEMLAVVRVDRQRRFELPKGIAPGAQNHREFVISRRGIKLIFVLIWRFREVLPVVFFQIEVYGVAKLRSDGTIGAKFSDTVNLAPM